MVGGLSDVERFAIYPDDLIDDYQVPDRIGSTYLLTGLGIADQDDSDDEDVKEEEKKQD